MPGRIVAEGQSEHKPRSGDEQVSVQLNAAVTQIPLTNNTKRQCGHVAMETPGGAGLMLHLFPALPLAPIHGYAENPQRCTSYTTFSSQNTHLVLSCKFNHTATDTHHKHTLCICLFSATRQGRRSL